MHRDWFKGVEEDDLKKRNEEIQEREGDEAKKVVLEEREKGQYEVELSSEFESDSGSDGHSNSVVFDWKSVCPLKRKTNSRLNILYYRDN